MKKIYLSIFVAISSVASFAQTVPTCTQNAAFIAGPKVGVYPDSVTNFISGIVGVPYQQDLTVKVPKDTLASGIRICFNRFEVFSPSGVTNYNLPSGLMLGSSDLATSGGTLFPGNSNHCASIYGTPTTAGTYSLQLGVKAFGTPQVIGQCSGSPNISGGTNVNTQTIKYYKIVIAAPQGVQEIGKDKIALYQNVPNPSSSTTDIKFYVEGEDNATITVYNALGSVVSQQSVKTILGENKVTVNTSDLASGTYIYSLKYKNAITTKRMMVINH